MRNKFISSSSESTLNWGIEFGRSLLPGCVLALKGELGAGKTTLIKGIVSGYLNINPHEITSPTFTYLHIYENENKAVFHFDLYRLREEADFTHLGFEEYINQRGLCCIEWPDRIPHLLPAHAVGITLSHVEQSLRSIVVEEIAICQS